VFVNLSHERLALLKWNPREKAGWIGSYWKEFCCDLKGQTLFSFEVEDGKDRQFRARSFIPIGFFETGRIEFLNLKDWCRPLRGDRSPEKGNNLTQSRKGAKQSGKEGTETRHQLKSVEKLEPVHFKQLLTYLRLTGLRLGLLINFGEAALKNGIHRIVNNLSSQALRLCGFA